MSSPLRSIFLIFLSAIVVGIAIFILHLAGIIPSQISPLILYSLLTLILGIWLVNVIGHFILRVLLQRAGASARAAWNIFRFVGYVVTTIVALSILGVSPEIALAGGAFSGLILGLGAQPLLGNFFAGVVLLLTGILTPGAEVRLLASSIPYQAVTSPSYKYFSPDYIDIGYRGTVNEVGLLYSTIITDKGLELKVPNQLILNSAVIDYSSRTSGKRRYQVRYEFDVRYDPDIVLNKLKYSLNGINNIDQVYLNEQSDKQYYITIVEFLCDASEDWRLIKSEILKKIIGVHKELLLNVRSDN